MQEGGGQVEGLLRADVPEAAEGAAVDPDHAFSQLAGIEKGVRWCVDVEGGPVEAGPGAGLLRIGEFLRCECRYADVVRHMQDLGVLDFSIRLPSAVHRDQRDDVATLGYPLQRDNAWLGAFAPLA